MKKALFIRLDRMGDLVLTLPVDQLIKDNYQVHWVTPHGLDFVVQSSAPTKDYSTMKSDFSWKQFLKFFKLVKNVKPDVSISFHVPWWINAALFLALVPRRGGVLSQWHSYLFLNKGLRQKRSRCEHHEMEYNYLLVEHVMDLPKDKNRWTPLTLEEPKLEKELGFDVNQDYFVVHPGMGGSALNWPTERYKELIDQLSEKATVVVTGTKGDDSYLTPLKKSLKDNHHVVWLDKQLDGYQLLKLLKHAITVTAPSTGVLHLSASLGVPSMGIYSPIKVHQDKRWGPKGEKTATFTPDVQCPAHFECLKEACDKYPCMAQLPTEKISTESFSYMTH
ncbi:MAG: glycosyltransferase family 9 protein [Bdellovibrionales bacterium]|nr:glycosyltransferase family 9 protein [Bdellovibrionales bacterium]NQZ18958.1 glycosyltransferase family 9 protein [Bdellovibrionales bacterium]